MNYIKYIYAFAILFSIVSCNKFVDIPLPVDKLTSDVVFSDSVSAEATVGGIYVQLIGSSYTSFLNGNVTLYPSLSAGEISNSTSSTSFDAFRLNELSSDNTMAWAGSFNIIYHCNLVIENLKKSSLSTSQKNRLDGECRFLRALNLFYLVNFYGDIPFPLTPTYLENSLLPRSKTEIVYNSILNDLKIAANELPQQNINDSRTRANKWAAKALLARVYLYTKQYQSAITEAGDVIASNKFPLENIGNVFLSGNKEMILSWSPPLTQIFVVADAYRFIPGSKTVVPSFVIQPSLMGMFGPTDLRKTNWIGNNIVSGVTYYYPNKYKVRTVSTGTVKPESNIVLRIAEQYLIRAEAYAQLSEKNLAIDDLNRIKQRASAQTIDKSTYSGNTENLLQLIYDEKQREFFAEWGHRWFDLKRTNKVGSVMSLINPNTWQDADALYPIPQSDILSNPNLVQNPGYN
jgi:hypothetical protein